MPLSRFVNDTDVSAPRSDAGNAGTEIFSAAAEAKLNEAGDGNPRDDFSACATIAAAASAVLAADGPADATRRRTDRYSSGARYSKLQV